MCQLSYVEVGELKLRQLTFRTPRAQHNYLGIVNIAQEVGPCESSTKTSRSNDITVWMSVTKLSEVAVSEFAQSEALLVGNLISLTPPSIHLDVTGTCAGDSWKQFSDLVLRTEPFDTADQCFAAQ